MNNTENVKTKINVKIFKKDENRSLIEAWCTLRKFPVIDEGMLSDFGFMSYEGGMPVAAQWMYPMMGSSLCFVGFPISDPSILKETRDKCLDTLYSHIAYEAKQCGYNLLFTNSGKPSVQSRLEKHGWTKGDENVKQYFMRL